MNCGEAAKLPGKFGMTLRKGTCFEIFARQERIEEAVSYESFCLQEWMDILGC
jgi:hypothetical protein